MQLLYPRLPAEKEAAQQPQHVGIDLYPSQVERRQINIVVSQAGNVPRDERSYPLVLEALLVLGLEVLREGHAALDAGDGDVPHDGCGDCSVDATAKATSL